MMKISQSSDNPVPVGAGGPPVPAKGGQNTASTANANATQGSRSAGVAVTVSTLARTLAASRSDETADVDTEKVDSVRAAIQDGTYKVNPEAIADKLLANAQEMLNRTRN
jgi:negative regulator of flagellin synthesis FlgM